MTNNSKKLWNKAKQVIPGGNGLLSKRPERYAPLQWPTYFATCNGLTVEDLHGNCFKDMGMMGVGSSILGYAHPELTQTVQQAVANGVNCTLNCTEELRLAEKLVAVNRRLKMVRFARGGGEAMSIAIRIARTFSKSEKILFSGYHGWCDWYLSANLYSRNSLNEHLLKGIPAKGIPKGLAGTAIPFRFNDLKDLKKTLNNNRDALCICVEGAREEYANKEFLEEIFDFRSRNKKAVVIFDEITSGFRCTESGVYLKYGVYPDLAIYGKGLGGGFAISAVVGKERVMQSAQKTFLSSTMWTERVGFAAGLKTLEILQREKAWLHFESIGSYIKKNWEKLGKDTGVKIKVSEVLPLVKISFEYGRKNKEIETFFITKMLKHKYLSNNSIYVSLAHTKQEIDQYFKYCKIVFEEIHSHLENNKKMIRKELIRSEGFRRLT